MCALDNSMHKQQCEADQHRGKHQHDNQGQEWIGGIAIDPRITVAHRLMEARPHDAPMSRNAPSLCDGSKGSRPSALRMIAIVYRCPGTRLVVDYWFEPAEKPETYESVVCRACNRVHLVNVTSGRVLVASDQKSTAAPVQSGTRNE